MRRRSILITLSLFERQRLAEIAAQEERAVDQQASYLLRRALAALSHAGQSDANRAEGDHVSH